MHLDPITGLWKNDDNDYNPKKNNESVMDEIDNEIASFVRETEKTQVAPVFTNILNCKCVLSIRFEEDTDYRRWLKYCASEPRWDFIPTYPAIMKAEYKLKNTFDVDMMVKKIIHLLQNGFDVHSASWKIEEKNDA